MSGPDADEPDRVVETALRLLPVPEHAPDFWSRLEARLDAEPGPVTAPDAPVEPARPSTEPSAEEPAAPTTDPVPVVTLEPVAPLGVVPPAMRRPSNLVLSVVAVAAAVAVVVAGASLLRSRTAEDRADEVAEAASEGTDGGDSAGEAEPAPLTLTAPDYEPAAAMVVTWLGHLAEGDVDAAWEALSPQSQDSWGSPETFAAEQSALSEGYGAWASARADEVIVTPLIEGELELVTLVGTVAQEGMSQVRADAFPVRWVSGDAALDLYADAGPVEIVAPRADRTDGIRQIAAGDEIVIVVPDHGADPLLRIDSEEPVVCGTDSDTVLTALDDAPARRCGYQPTALEPGDHTLTVVHMSADGTRVTAHSVRFTVV